ncbi:MAG: tail fiber domain-containing protein [Bryobacterales bacterium]|nr:tail fiber domain-containing protein [Bryobacterales bacterium]
MLGALVYTGTATAQCSGPGGPSNVNTACGAGALSSNTSGVNNSAFGFDALFSNIGGLWNTADGYAALFSNTFGFANTANGVNALNANTNGGENTASGVNALLQNTFGGENAASGVNALYSNTFGGINTANGAYALWHNTNGGNNIGIGFDAGANVVNGSNNIEIGTSGTADESNTIRIGKLGTQTATFLAGINSAMLSSGTPVVINSNQQLGVLPSSARYKRDIRNMGSSSAALMTLRPVTFRYKNDPKGERQFGLIAEEVARVYPELVSYDPDGKPQTVQYQNLIAMLLNELQKQSNELHREVVANQKQAQEIAQLRTTQEHQIGALEARLEALEHVKAARNANGVATAAFDR